MNKSLKTSVCCLFLFWGTQSACPCINTIENTPCCPHEAPESNHTPDEHCETCLTNHYIETPAIVQNDEYQSLDTIALIDFDTESSSVKYTTIIINDDVNYYNYALSTKNSRAPPILQS